MYKLFDCSDRNWNLILREMPINVQDIYYTSEYYKMHENNGDGIGRLFFYSDREGNMVFYPFMLNKIDGYNLERDYFDIETAYGYGGPITNCSAEKFLVEFEKAFLDYCKSSNIVAEFVRFHPLINNEKIFNTKIQVTHNRCTVYLDLTKGIDKIWDEDISTKNRNVIRKTKKRGLYVEITNDYYTFKDIYNSTMKKVDADDYYYFNDRYYGNIKENSNYVLMNVKREDKVIATAIFMGYGDYFHYHLAGSLKEELSLSPNNLLLWEAISYAVSKGYKKMHFGGGLTDSLEDNLFKFKSRFSKNYTDFYIGKRIHNQEVYEYLIAEWERRNNKKANLLLQYRIK
ncbi:MAG: GNAT family N-acetyltransferase [Tissierellia bacterium]|nr:GNAT family N-acetyltransferase [Tissierellia bacterium]